MGWEGQKEFVAHHYFHNFLWDKITGKNFNWNNYFLFWKILYLPLAILLFCFLPFVIMIDSLSRKIYLLFVSLEMLKKKNEEKQEKKKSLAKAINISIVPILAINDAIFD